MIGPEQLPGTLGFALMAIAPFVGIIGLVAAVDANRRRRQLLVSVFGVIAVVGLVVTGYSTYLMFTR